MNFYQDERITQLSTDNYEVLIPTTEWPGFLEEVGLFMQTKNDQKKLRAQLEDAKSQVEFLQSELDGLQDTYDNLLVKYNELLPKTDPDVSSRTSISSIILASDDTAGDIPVVAGEPDVQEVTSNGT
jgi:hypothetical protein